MNCGMVWKRRSYHSLQRGHSGTGADLQRRSLQEKPGDQEKFEFLFVRSPDLLASCERQAANQSQRVVRTERRRDLRIRGNGREVLAGVDEAVRLEFVLLVVERPVAARERDQ